MLSPKSIIEFIKSKATALGQSVVYSALLMYYAWKRPDTPAWAKRIIMGAVAYLLAPIDAIPDLTPFIGFTDDVSVLSASLITIAYYINDDVKQSAKKAMGKYFNTVDAKSIDEVDDKLQG